MEKNSPFGKPMPPLTSPRDYGKATHQDNQNSKDKVSVPCGEDCGGEKDQD